jgi:putative aldouronate transport system permease protein
MRTRGEKTFDIINIVLMALFCLMIIYPVWNTVVISLNDATDAMMGGLYWWPRKFSLESYKTVLETPGIFKAFGVTVGKTVIGVVTHVLFTAMVAYGLSKRDLVGRKLYLTVGVITMFFNGGLIPNYLLIRNLGLLDNFMVYIIPALFSFFDLIIFQSFFRELPASLEESAFIDGANEFQIFLKIILPLSMPVMATIALFNGVYQWNDFFTGIIYINNPDLQPIQTFLYKVIVQNSSSQMLSAMPAAVTNLAKTTSESIKLATMVIATLPIVLVYPFLQKYFVKGMLLGSVKE